MAGLGRGLDALFAESSVLKEMKQTENNSENIKNIKLIEIEPNTTQARKKFNEDTLNELAESIKTYGVLQPIIVEQKKDYYSIIAGERRWRAAKIAGLTEIPCLIRNEDEQRVKEISLIENIQRENLNPIEKALGYKELIDNYNLKQQELADKLGINRTAVTNTLRILNLDKRVMELAIEGKLSEGHCRSLLGITDPDKQYKAALRIIEKGQSVKELEKSMKNRKTIKEVTAKYEPLYREIEDSFQSFFGTKVKLTPKKRSGRIVIEYNSNDDLERLLDLIKNQQ